MDDVAECEEWDLNRKPSLMILYLGQFNCPMFSEKWDVPADLTQPAIAKGVGMARSNICRHMGDLIDHGFVEKKMKHILHHARKRNAYFLTYKGMRAYRVLKARQDKENPQ